MSENYYDILGVSKTASQDEIKKAFRKIAIDTHPDKHPGDKACEEKFKKANEAYSTLSDEGKRKEYDDKMNNPFAGMNGGGFGFRSGNVPPGFDMNDIFSQFFGGRNPFEQQTRHSQNYEQPQDLNIRLQVKITFEESYCGCKKTFRFNSEEACDSCNGTGFDKNSNMSVCKTCGGNGFILKDEFVGFMPGKRKVICPECNGKGKHNERKCSKCSGSGKKAAQKTITVTIPKGAYDGMEMRVKGMGNIGKNGAVGDVYLILSVPKYSQNGVFFREEGFNINTVLNLTYYDLICGSTEKIIMPDGEVKTFKIPENCKPGSVVKLKNCGFKTLLGNISSQEFGDLLVTVNLKSTGKLSDEQKELLKKFNDSLK